MTLSTVFLLFISYSVMGWVLEVLYCSLRERRMVNRGFLSGPLCPVYGFGGLLVVFLLKPFSDNVFYLFTMGLFLASILEYGTGWVLETIFSTKWWDYSSYRFHIHGRVCLLNSLMFGAVSVVCVRFIHPFMLTLLAALPSGTQDVLSLALASVLAVDIVLTLKTLINLDVRLTALREFTEGLRDRLDVGGWFNEHDLHASFERLKTLAVGDNTETLARLSLKFESLLAHSRGMRRIFAAFPAMRSRNHDIQLRLFAHIRERAKEAELPPTGFAAGFGFFKQVWIFFASGFLGVVLETVWCVITRGHIESRSGLVFGMFNPLYGAGALLITGLFARVEKNNGDVPLFFGGLCVGGLFEYLSSLGLELVFGMKSWDFGGTLLNLHGRTNLLSVLIWGVLALVWVRGIFPVFSRLVERIPPVAGKTAAFVLIALFAINAGVSGFAVHRWAERMDGLPPSNALETVLDRQFPDELLRAVYPDMKRADQPILSISYGVSW